MAFTPYKCGQCGRPRQTSHNYPPELCPTCMLDTRAATTEKEDPHAVVAADGRSAGSR